MASAAVSCAAVRVCSLAQSSSSYSYQPRKPSPGVVAALHTQQAQAPSCAVTDNGSTSSVISVSLETVSRRAALAALVSAAAAAAASDSRFSPVARAAPGGLPTVNEDEIKICGALCEDEIANLPIITTSSGLQFRDIAVGSGPSPPVGFQVSANCVAMLPTGRVFDSSIEKKMPYIFRIGAGQVIAGLDEGIQTMKVGGVRRLYIPGDLAFPKGLSAAAGRPRVAPKSPVVFDVELLYIPGLDDLEEDEE
eukprot:TRINITY_DN11040_c0_g1_i1.p1 TRINITY_DN11040_c0_g1~~TRINITY_DN11040_c0_g1_i1.p1  ORF type:complete len:251 (+),score=63.27 TRINITY_DN11040_c0_g1_i1:139-891(+)